jgi:hypothetical protein
MFGMGHPRLSALAFSIRVVAESKAVSPGMAKDIPICHVAVQEKRVLTGLLANDAPDVLARRNVGQEIFSLIGPELPVNGVWWLCDIGNDADVEFDVIGRCLPVVLVEILHAPALKDDPFSPPPHYAALEMSSPRHMTDVRAQLPPGTVLHCPDSPPCCHCGGSCRQKSGYQCSESPAVDPVLSLSCVCHPALFV